MRPLSFARKSARPALADPGGKTGSACTALPARAANVVMLRLNSATLDGRRAHGRANVVRHGRGLQAIPLFGPFVRLAHVHASLEAGAVRDDDARRDEI